MAGSILHIGAHPDDEDIGMVAYMARKFGVRVVYWSATRGEGGQNRIGPYQGAALGVYRTWESLSARMVDGGEALFGAFIDFGFSKNAAEALNKWGRERTVREIVRAIRLVQPAIVIGRWQGTPGDGHGHHQAIGEATLEAFEAAGDPASFPELGEQGLAPWQPRKLYLSTMGDWQPGEAVEFGQILPAFERDGVVRLNSGEYDPIAGRTYQEQAWIGFNAHQTQAMGVVPALDNFYYYYSLHTSLVAVPPKETSFYDNLDPTLTGLADYPGYHSTFLRARLAEIKARASAALERYRPEDPLAAARPLLEGVSLLRDLQSALPQQPFEAEVKRALGHYLARKTVDFEITAANCLGLRLECLTDDAHITPGQSFHLSARLWNHRGVRLDQIDFSPHLPEAWTVQVTQAAGTETDLCRVAYTVTAAETAELSCVYWLREPAQAYCYTWPAGEPASRPFASSLVEVACRVTLGHHHLYLHQPAVLR